MILNKHEADKVIGEIYKITNITNGKSYVGQTRSHRLNHDKYRPFGYMGRFKDHVHEANSSKKNKSWYLNSALLKYGIENFTCELLHTCPVSELNEHEIDYISQYNTKFPNGYNLTTGGQNFIMKNGPEKSIENVIVFPKPVKTCPKKSDYTKNLISERLKESCNTPEHRNKMMKLTQIQHADQKFEKFKDVVIDSNDIEKYIRHRINHKTNEEFFKVVIGKVKTSFVGRYEPISDKKERAREFIRELINRQNTLLLGTPLEPSPPLSSGNIGEELG
jgi:group I intron endonuclease